MNNIIVQFPHIYDLMIFNLCYITLQLTLKARGVVASAIFLFSLCVVFPISLFVWAWGFPHPHHRPHKRLLREAPTIETRAVVEEHIKSLDVVQILRGKCFDNAPNCRKESCQDYHISLWNKCKKTCGKCDQIP